VTPDDLVLSKTPWRCSVSHGSECDLESPDIQFKGYGGARN
jgi:hypothetical protein